MRQNQPDLLTRESIRNKGISFTIDNNADNTSTLSVRLNLTERNRVNEQNQTLQVQYEPEPTPPEPVSRPTALYIAGELVSPVERELIPSTIISSMMAVANTACFS
ncbi:P2 phage tail completion protein R (GpR) [Dickeya solani]|uniref:phage tail protein n=1 Tax=Dickeya solani TaxID=1089444 RepID=UPI000F43870F|nr:phage tail protein [Dickeya solani]AYQ48260.1 P2 phage tail completion protein R (GpR) [Dickeya solani]